jgi:adenylosuccinate synthase
MPVTVVVGGQKGDEGKGKITAYLAIKHKYDVCIRVSGPNAGHTLQVDNQKVGLATIPCGYLCKESKLIIGRGAFIGVDRLLEEIKKTHLEDSGRLFVDRWATVISEDLQQAERSNERLMKGIGSVGTGLGPARIRKIERGDVVFAKDVPQLKPYLADTTEIIFEALTKNKKLLLEGDQGFSLSLVHGEYPYVTSRDTTASTFLGEAGIGPRAVDEVYIVFKPYVTRVGPGPLADEVQNTPEWFRKEGGEIGTVSGRKRRIAAFEWENAKRAIQINGASRICVTHMDAFRDDLISVTGSDEKGFLSRLKADLTSTYPYPKLALLSYGPNVEDIRNLAE